MWESEIGSEEAAEEFEGKTAAGGVIAKLVFTNLTDGEITGLGMGEHEARDTGMGLHGATLCETDAYLTHVDQIVDDEVQTGVGERGVTHGWTDALELLNKHIGDGEILVFGIPPKIFTNLFVHARGGCLFKTVGQEPGHHLAIGVGVEVGLEGGGDGGGKEGYFRGGRVDLRGGRLDFRGGRCD